MGLLSMPNELLVRSLTLLSYADLARCAMYAFLLGLTGMQDGVGAEGVAARLAKLRQYQKARSKPLENATATIQPLPEECIEESSGNIVAYVDCAEDADDTVIHLVQLPSPLRGVESRRWTIFCSDSVTAFSVESSMDLLVVVIERAGEPHPRAQKPSWTCELPDAYAPNVSILIIEDKLAMDFVHGTTTASSSFRLWNWETGEQYSLPAIAREGACCFLDSQHIAVLAEPANDPSCKKTRTAAFDILRLKSPSDVRRVVRLCLPRYKKWSRPGLLEWVSDQRPASCDYNRTRNALSAGCFAAGPCARIVGLRVPSHDCFEETPLFIMSVTKLLRLTVGWEDWGPRTTRLFLHHESTYMSIRVTRYVLQRTPLAHRPGFFVFDFGCDKFRAEQGDEQFERSGARVTASTRDTSKYFDGPITTHLPYHSLVHHLDEDTWNRCDLTTVREIDDGVIVGQLDHEEMDAACTSTLLWGWLSRTMSTTLVDSEVLCCSLPTELLVQSLKLLPHDDLARLMMVCTGLRDVIRETASLQYAFLLGLNGMQDGAGAMDTATRLARLRQYETDMRQLRFSATIIPIPARDPIYKVAGDTIAYMTDDEGTKRLDFVRTPSHLRGVGDTIKWRVDCPVGIREFFIEPSQNLLVVLRIHSLWNWQTGEAYAYRTAAKDKFMRWVWDGVPASRDHECTDRNSSTSGCFASRPHSRPLGLQISSGRSTTPFVGVLSIDDGVVLVQILHYLDAVDIARCRAVCRVLCGAIDGTPTLWYKQKLGMHNMVNGGDQHETLLADRVQRAERYVKAWRSLEWSTETRIPFGGNLWEIAGGVVACTTSAGSGEISFTQLPSPLRDIERKTWRLTLRHVPRDFTIDPSQDLLVSIHSERQNEYDVHLLSMSTGEQHPAAQISPLVYKTNRTPVQYELLVYEDRLGILFVSNDEAARFNVWDWKTGQEYRPPFQDAFITSACFLDANTVMATAYTHQITAPNNVFLKVVDITTPDAPMPISHLQFPIMHPNTDAMADLIWDSPPTWEGGVPPIGCFAHTRTRLIGIAMSAWVMTVDLAAGPAARRVPLMFILSISEILARLPRRETASFPVSVSWEDWGTHAAHIFDRETSQVWVCYVRGPRYALLDELPLDAPPSAYTVYDFSPGPTRAETAELKGSFYEDRDVFVDPVKACLPCRKIQGRIPLRPNMPEFMSVMLADDGVVFVSDSGEEFWAWTS
ncbi:uncharacterized protein SCHCODRAFT_02599201 [Schizophyllum commune H4-8]|uniref:F-box domain-containing protein n=1 Tax=Schizophyllum commune (strain H4-8 / FGSC 9210) TaxID=578458 RepID=D8PRM4_SCHCM|nr:uncharacterized protein SCHCODRAFT_02599201 [Schizophyllum commune H4-8]KAI5893854.1 hypothetical protein SCHCODRAFT_02599201 [Schizophyllum commune H4-8]